jgi:lipid-A-disaccharide synthase
LIIFIDYPGFNLHMAKHAKLAGVKVLYYVSPQIWAWRYGRIKKIKKYVDRMAVLFGFEEKIYQKENVPVNFVGHPLIDNAVPTLSREQAYQQFALNPNQPIVGLFPGSRRQEISRLLPDIVNTVRLLQQRMPTIQWILPLASNLSLDDVRDYLIPEIKVIQNNTYNVLPLCDTAIAASGTVTLEIAINQVPLVIIYKVTPFSYWLGKTLLYIPFIGLCNIVAGERVAVELIQKAATPEAIVAEVSQLLFEKNYRQTAIEKLAKVKENLGEKGSSARVAQVVLDML